MKRVLIMIMALIAIAACADAATLISKKNWGSIMYAHSTETVATSGKVENKSGPDAVWLGTARNEYESFQIVVSASYNIGRVSVSPRRLTSSSGNEIAAWNIQAGLVDTGMQGMPDDIITGEKSARVSGGTNAVFWVTVFTGPKTVPGTYTGSVEISGKSIGKINIPLNVTVRDFSLPTVSSLPTSVTRDMNGIASSCKAKTTDDKNKLLKTYNIDAWRHRVSPDRPHAFHPISGGYTSNGWELDFSDFDKAIDDYFYMFTSFAFPTRSELREQTAMTSPSYITERANIEYTREVAYHLINKGQLRKAYDIVKTQYRPDGTLDIKAIKADAQKRRLADQNIRTALFADYTYGLSGDIDIWFAAPGSTRAQQDMKSEYWWKVDTDASSKNSYLSSNTKGMRNRSLCAQAYEKDIDGIYISQKSHGLFYPDTQKQSSGFANNKPLSTVRYEILRDSLEDYEYLVIHEKKMGNKSEFTIDKETTPEELELIRSRLSVEIAGN